MKQHVYQFALRRADNEKKQFIIETDTVYTDDKFTEQQAQEISKKYQCDLKITYLGVLTPTKKEEIIDIEYHSKDMIEAHIIAWKEKEREAFTNGFETDLRV